MPRLVLILALLLSAPAMAAEDPAASDQPVEISADSLEVIQPEQQAIFRGNVVAVQGETRIKSDTMRVFYTKKGEGTDTAEGGISRIEVQDHVQMATPDEAATADKGEYQVAAKLVTLTGNVVLTRGPNVLKGEKLVYNLQTGKSLLTASASAEGGAASRRVRGVFLPSSK